MAEIIFLGTGAGAPGGRRLPTTLAVKAGGHLYLLDCGGPAANLLAAAGEPFDTLEALFLSHLHTDHAGGVPLLLQNLLMAGRERPFPTLAPPRSAERLLTAARALLVEPERYPFAWSLEEAAPGETYTFRDLAVLFIPNQHLARHPGPAEPPQACSLYLNVEGSGLLYSGDVANPEELASHVRQSDLLLHELGHHMPEDVLDFAARYGVPRLAFVHLHPMWEGREAELWDMARSRYPGELIIPREGERITV